MFRKTFGQLVATACAVSLGLAVLAAQRGGADNPFPGGTNPDGSLRPTPPLTRLFTQDAYTEYSILEPGSESFRVRFLPEETRTGATELVNATRGGSEGSDIEVYDPRTGKPMPFTYEQDPKDPETHAIHAKLPIPVPDGGVGRVLIYKTYKDPRTYQMHGDDIVWVRSLSGYRLGVLLAQGVRVPVVERRRATVDDQRRPPEARLRQPERPEQPGDDPRAPHHRDLRADEVRGHVLRRRQDALRPGHAGDRIASPSTSATATSARARRPRSTRCRTCRSQDLKVVDLDTAKALTPVKSGASTTVKLEMPITSEYQSAHLKLSGTITDPAYTVDGGRLVFARTLKGLRNTVLLPAGWEVSAVSQSATIGQSNGRAFVSLINLNAENQYTVRIEATRAAGTH